MKLLAACAVHDDWEAVLQTIITGEMPEAPP